MNNEGTRHFAELHEAYVDVTRRFVVLQELM